MTEQTGQPDLEPDDDDLPPKPPIDLPPEEGVEPPADDDEVDVPEEDYLPAETAAPTRPSTTPNSKRNRCSKATRPTEPVPRAVNLPPDLTDGMRRRNGGPDEPDLARARRRPRPGLFETVPRLLAFLATAFALAALLMLGLWKAAELIARALG